MKIAKSIYLGLSSIERHDVKLVPHHSHRGCHVALHCSCRVPCPSFLPHHSHVSAPLIQLVRQYAPVLDPRPHHPLLAQAGHRGEGHSGVCTVSWRYAHPLPPNHPHLTWLPTSLCTIEAVSRPYRIHTYNCLFGSGSGEPLLLLPDVLLAAGLPERYAHPQCPPPFKPVRPFLSPPHTHAPPCQTPSHPTGWVCSPDLSIRGPCRLSQRCG